MRYPEAPLEPNRVRQQGLGWRIALVGLAVALGLGGFLSGVEVTERTNVQEAGLFAHIYYTLGLFIFGGMDLGTPTGGPFWGRAALWTAYFLAPLITVSAVIEAVALVLGPERLMQRRLSGHIIVVGSERLTHLYLRRLRSEGHRRPVLVVGPPGSMSRLEDLRDRFRVYILEGRPTSRVVMRRLRLDQAARILVLTDDDFHNFDIATRMLEYCPSAAHRLTVHVRDLLFLRSMHAFHLPVLTSIFNGHSKAATTLVQDLLLGHFHNTATTDVVVIAGFGSFGQTVLNQLQTQAKGQFDRVLLLDNQARLNAATFKEQVGFDDSYRCDVYEGDIRFPELWQAIMTQIDKWTSEPVVIVGSGDDQANVRVALTLAHRYPEALIIARNEEQWSFADDLAREAKIHIVSVAQLVTESMPAQWFEAQTDPALSDAGRQNRDPQPKY